MSCSSSQQQQQPAAAAAAAAASSSRSSQQQQPASSSQAAAAAAASSSQQQQQQQQPAAAAAAASSSQQQQQQPAAAASNNLQWCTHLRPHTLKGHVFGGRRPPLGFAMKTSWDKSCNAFFFPAHLGLCLRASPFGADLLVVVKKKKKKREVCSWFILYIVPFHDRRDSGNRSLFGLPFPPPSHTMQGVRRLLVWNPRLCCALLLFYTSRIPDRNPRSFSCGFSNPRPYPEVVFTHPLRIRANPRIVLRRWFLLRRLQTQAIAVNPQQAAHMFQHPRPKASHNVFR